MTIVEDSTKITWTLLKNVCVPINTILVLMLNELVLPVMALVEQLKRHVAKGSLQRSLNNQILDYKAILDLCENEIMSAKFFWISKDSMISVENLETEKWYEGGDTVPVTRSSHHLILLVRRWIISWYSVHQVKWPVYTTRFGGLAWLV